MLKYNLFCVIIQKICKWGAKMKLERLIGILTILLQNERVTATRLAERFEVSRRTIIRDIDALCMAGIPIVTQQGYGGGISIAEGFRLDKSILTKSELALIISGIKGIGTVSEKAQIANTLDKLGANAAVDTPVVVDLASFYKEDLTDKIETIKQAIAKQRLIQFVYHYEKGESQRCIEPYLVIFQWAAWYVFGFCRKRMDWRLFKLNRLRQLSLLDEAFEVREMPPEHTNFNKHLQDDKWVTALFDASVEYQLVESYGFESFVKTNDGLYFEAGFTHMEYMTSWLLSFGDKVRVLEPPELVCEIKRIAKNIFSQYA